MENGEEWSTPMGRSIRKSTIESGGCELDVNGGRQVEYKYLKRGIPGIYISNRRNARQWVAVNPSPISSRTRTKFKHKT